VIDEFDQNVHFVEIDIEEDPEVAEAAGIMGTPCVQFFKKKEMLRCPPLLLSFPSHLLPLPVAMAAIANPTALSPPTALASQKPVASHFPSSLRPLSSASSPSSSSSAYALHSLHRIAIPWLPIIPRKLDSPLVRLEAAAVADAETDLAEGEAASDSDSAVATAPPPSKPKTGKAALPLKRDRTRSKRFLEIQKLRENKKEYDVPAAVSLLKQTSNTKFVESAEAHFRLNIDPKYNDQQLRATVLIPSCTLV
ncbi:hypothetical protein B296_00044279, partial [Ensete ventricosum]